ncbi:hypothetical protein ABIF65_003319 [Bradyrhizobium japonicum]|jgi:hypothetical protein|uniref:hypothetical protein n=1 Tax=Bradyrhizobium TaxID=374 RepID=UPI0004245766|nr:MULTISPECIES: hypothetical protein [Bradyrhizobium]MBR0947376.1 hypothetical protein [Bradyrhizobium liaoningense]MBR1001017.1 hypothetical protein [Bradyrhizobium liaoningense]MBR1068683.1 hypothetical protein [Bradyrhizobium liaoningense]MCP1741322.1 hypothetical protein [Bradyrhizobium japonicum]MCP1766306.1 hypothetical protein [Bradyrhizobium japonicum]
MKTIAIGFVVIYLLFVFVRASPEGAVMIGTVALMIGLAVFYPTGFAILLGSVFLICMAVALFVWTRKAWRWSRRDG